MSRKCVRDELVVVVRSAGQSEEVKFEISFYMERSGNSPGPKNSWVEVRSYKLAERERSWQHGFSGPDAERRTMRANGCRSTDLLVGGDPKRRAESMGSLSTNKLLRRL